MDTVTHAMTGLILAAPFAIEHPLTAGCLALGAVLPDIDALARVGGKAAFLTWHQTVTHSVFAIIGYAVVGTLATLVISPGEWFAGLALAAGAGVHVLLDVSNTYGVAWLAPRSMRRICLEWVFFIDSTVVALCVGCLIVLARDMTHTGLAHAGGVCLVFWLVVAAYGLLKASLRRAAIARAGQPVDSMIPSAMWPWVWYGYALDGEFARICRVDLLRGVDEERVPVFDGRYEDLLNGNRSYQAMKGLSLGYHLVCADTQGSGFALICRDLRVRNFGGKFGKLELSVDHNGEVSKEVLHV